MFTKAVNQKIDKKTGKEYIVLMKTNRTYTQKGSSILMVNMIAVHYSIIRLLQVQVSNHQAGNTHLSPSIVKEGVPQAILPLAH